MRLLVKQVIEEKGFIEVVGSVRLYGRQRGAGTDTRNGLERLQ